MPNIRPSSDLRNNYNEISLMCHEADDAIYITKNGTGDLAIMSIEAYEALTEKLDLYKMALNKWHLKHKDKQIVETALKYMR